LAGDSSIVSSDFDDGVGDDTDPVGGGEGDDDDPVLF
jgi:hypothetical protein